MFDQRFDAAEGYGECDEPDGVDERASRFDTAAQLERDHRSRSRHLTFCELILRMRRQAGIAEPGHFLAPFQPLRERDGVGLSALDAHSVRADSAQDEPGLMRIDR